MCEVTEVVRESHGLIGDWTVKWQHSEDGIIAVTYVGEATGALPTEKLVDFMAEHGFYAGYFVPDSKSIQFKQR